MLINTLSMFLHEMLPIFFLSSMLAALLEKMKSRFHIIGLGILVGTLLSIIIQLFVSQIALLFSGFGVEILFFTIACSQVACLSVLLLLLRHFDNQMVAILSIALLILTMFQGGTDFLIFVNNFWIQQHIGHALLIGIAIGASISLSLAVLLYFFLNWLAQHNPLTLYIFPALFVAGQFSKAINLLAQIGIVESNTMWSTDFLLTDRSEFAQILSSMFGYEATPITAQIATYLLTLTALLTIIFMRRVRLIAAFHRNEKSP
ncbi:MAG: hypothetical protein WBN40_09110 [Pseudomonadales bacterium]